MTMTIYPAIDVRGARVVRLARGDYDVQTLYEEAPLVLARRYSAAGAGWLHLVDLDAARAGGYSLTPLLESIRSETALRVQTGGGIRSEAEVERVLGAGADRVVVGTAAVTKPSKVIGWIRRFGGERVAIALDTRRGVDGRWRLPVKGWTEDSPSTLDAVLDVYQDKGLKHLLCTDIERDGMLGGYNLKLYGWLQKRWPGLSVQASGGAASLDELAELRNAGVAGAVLGRALLEGRFTLPEALAC